MASLDGTNQAMAQSRNDGEGEADFGSLLSAQSGGNRQDSNHQGGASSALNVSVSSGEGAGSDSEGEGEMGAHYGPTPFAARPSRLPQPSGAEIEAELAALQRGPFRRILTDFLGFAPSAQALRNFANKHPDKWANALGIIAQLAGYKKEMHVEGTVNMVHAMSDAEIERRRRELREAEAASQRLINPAPRENDAARKLERSPAEPAPAPIFDPSRNDSIIDVPAKEIQ